MRTAITFRIYLGDARTHDARVEAIVRSHSSITISSITVTQTNGRALDLLGWLDDETMSDIRHELCVRWDELMASPGPPEDWRRDDMEGTA